jgi:hypothetical protein
MILLTVINFLDPFKVPRLSPRVSITSDKNLFGITNRTVAVESLRFLEEAMNIAKKLLQVTITISS